MGASFCALSFLQVIHLFLVLISCVNPDFPLAVPVTAIIPSVPSSSQQSYFDCHLTKLPIHFTFHFPISSELDREILKLLRLGQQLTLNQGEQSAPFLTDNHGHGPLLIVLPAASHRAANCSSPYLHTGKANITALSLDTHHMKSHLGKLQKRVGTRGILGIQILKTCFTLCKCQHSSYTGLIWNNGLYQRVWYLVFLKCTHRTLRGFYVFSYSTKHMQIGCVNSH